MLKTNEILTILAATTTVIGVSVSSTLYLVDSTTDKVNASDGGTRHAYDLGDAFFPCQDHVRNHVLHQVRNMVVDSRSSHYEEKDNAYVVYVDMEVTEKFDGQGGGDNYHAKAVCRVSAANNKVTGFAVRKG